MELELCGRTLNCGDYLATWHLDDMTDPWMIVSTLPPVDDEAKRLILALIMAKSIPLGDRYGMHISVGELIVHPVVVQQISPPKKWVARRLVLPQPDGTIIDCISEDVIRCLGDLVAETHQNPPWDPPVRVLVRRRNNKKGQPHWSLVPGV